MIDELISDSIDEIEGRPPAPRPPQPIAARPHSQPEGELVDCTVEMQDLAVQVRELTAQVGSLVTTIKRLREEEPGSNGAGERSSPL